LSGWPGTREFSRLCFPDLNKAAPTFCVADTRPTTEAEPTT
jgi:hypothetical protein